MRRLLIGGLCILFLGGCSIGQEPITKSEMKNNASDDMAFMFKGQEKVDGAITLEEAIARSIKYNLNNRVAIMEEALARGAQGVSRYDLLPQLTSKAGYSWRSQFSGATSQSLIDGTQSLVASTSLDRGHYTTGLGVSWNILDFGVSYAAAQQASDQLLISQQLRRKSVQNIVNDVKLAWWRAVVAQKLINDVDEVMKVTKAALKRSRQVEREKLKSPEVALHDQKTLMDLLQRLLSLKKQMSNALVELASLMNLQPGTDYKVAIPTEDIVPQLPSIPLEQIELAALVNRPEVIEANYNKRVSVLETRKTILKLFPGLNFTYDASYDSNKFSYFNYWNETGAQISWNIFNIFTFPERYEHAKTQEDLQDLKRMALSMAILSQVHISWQQYLESLGDYYLANEQQAVEGKLLRISNASKMANKGDELQRILSKTRELNAKMTKGLAFANLQGAVGRVYNTIGIDQMPGEVESHSLVTLSESIRIKLDTSRAELMREVEQLSGTSLPMGSDKEDGNGFDALFELISSGETSQEGRGLSQSSAPVKEGEALSWVHDGNDLVAEGKLAAAMNEWNRGVATLRKDQQVFLIGRYDGAYAPLMEYGKIDRSYQPFVVSKQVATGKGQYYLLALPLAGVGESTKEGLQKKLGNSGVEIIKVDSLLNGTMPQVLSKR